MSRLTSRFSSSESHTSRRSSPSTAIKFEYKTTRPRIWHLSSNKRVQRSRAGRRPPAGREGPIGVDHRQVGGVGRIDLHNVVHTPLIDALDQLVARHTTEGRFHGG